MSDDPEKRNSDDEDTEEDEATCEERPLVIAYCPNCTFPAEFCEFSGKLEGCKPWLETQKVALDSLQEKGKKKKKKDDDGVQELPGGKKKKGALKEVLVAVQRRGGRKHITTVKGMDQFGMPNILFIRCKPRNG